MSNKDERKGDEPDGGVSKLLYEELVKIICAASRSRGPSTLTPVELLRQLLGEAGRDSRNRRELVEVLQAAGVAGPSAVLTPIKETKQLVAERDDLKLKVEQLDDLKLKVEQLEVQLAGCSAAALGSAKAGDHVRPSDYGYSGAFAHVQRLRVLFECLKRDHEHVTGKPWVLTEEPKR